MAATATAISALRVEHDALVSLVDDVDPSDLERRSFAEEWTVAQVLAHLGSGAEINASNLRAALGRGERIPQEEYPKLWERWDHASPRDQREGFKRWHGELVVDFEDIQKTAPQASVDTMMGTLPASALAAIRLREAALHRWDIAAIFDHGARLLDDSVPLLADQLPEMVERLANEAAAGASDVDSVAIEAEDMGRSYVLSLRDGVVMRTGPGGSPETAVRLPAETLVRLFYGRFDEERDRGSVKEQPPGVLRDLRTIFRGF